MIQQLLGQVETRQIPVRVLTGPLPPSDPVEKEEVVPIQPGQQILMFPNWQQTQYPSVSLPWLASFFPCTVLP